MVVCILCSKELREGGKILVEKLKKFRPLIAVFNGKCKRFALAPSGRVWPPRRASSAPRLTLTLFLLFILGIYEMFCRELFGKKPKKLEFGLQPHKIPDCDVVSGTPC